MREIVDILLILKRMTTRLARTEEFDVVKIGVLFGGAGG